MGWFSKGKAQISGDPEALLGHLVQVATQGALVGTDQSADEVAEHLAADLAGYDRETLAGALGLAVVGIGAENAVSIKRASEKMLHALLDRFGAEEGVEAPTDLLPDDEPREAPQAADAAPVAEEKVWDEDRR